MTLVKGDLPPNVYVKSGSAYHVHAEGKRRIWKLLCRIDKGLPAVYKALSELRADAVLVHDLMPALIAEWQQKIMAKHAARTQADETRRCKHIAEAFPTSTARQIETVDVVAFLEQAQDRPRTFNGYRETFRELMRFAETKGYRSAGSNPVLAIRTMSTPPRKRYITDSELRRIKVAAMKNTDALDRTTRNRSGPMVCCLIDMAYLTGQAIGDLLDLRWQRDAADPLAPHVASDGIWFARKKLRKTTREEVLIEWSPKLRDVIQRARLVSGARPMPSDWVFTQKHGEPYTYNGAHTAYFRACKRAGVAGCTFHDLRAKALTDKEEREGLQAARVMGSHSTEQQTSSYIRNKQNRRIGATR